MVVLGSPSLIAHTVFVDVTSKTTLPVRQRERERERERERGERERERERENEWMNKLYFYEGSGEDSRSFYIQPSLEREREHHKLLNSLFCIAFGAFIFRRTFATLCTRWHFVTSLKITNNLCDWGLLKSEFHVFAAIFDHNDLKQTDYSLTLN